MSTDREMAKEDVVKYYSAVKNEIMLFSATWMHLEIIIASEVSQKEKGIYHVISLNM